MHPNANQHVVLSNKARGNSDWECRECRKLKRKNEQAADEVDIKQLETTIKECKIKDKTGEKK